MCHVSYVLKYTNLMIILFEFYHNCELETFYCETEPLERRHHGMQNNRA